MINIKQLIVFILLSFFITFCGSSEKQKRMSTTSNVIVLNQSWNLKIESDISKALKSLNSPIANGSSTYILNSLKKLSLEINRCSEKFRQPNSNLISPDFSQLAQFRFDALINAFKNAEEQTVKYAPKAFETVTSAIECCLTSVAVFRSLPDEFDISYVQKLEKAEHQLAKAFVANSLKNHKDAELALQNARNIATTLKNPYLLYEFSLFEGLKYFENAHYTKAIEQFKNALNFLDDIPNSNYQKAIVLYNLGRIRRTLAQYSVALENLKESINLLKYDSSENYALFSNIVSVQGLCYLDAGQYKRSIKFIERALIIKKKYSEGNDHQESIFLNDLGLLYNSLAQYEKSIHYYEESLSIDRLILGPEHPSVAVTFSNIGVVLNEQGNYEKALKYHLKAYRILTKQTNKNNVPLSSVLNNLGASQSDLNQHAEALENYKRALGINIYNFGFYHPDVAIVYSNIGVLLNEIGENIEAMTFHQNALEINNKIYGEGHPVIAACLNNIGVTFCRLGQYEKALEYLQNALEMKRILPFLNERSVADTIMSLGHALRNLGRIDEAVSKYEEALVLRRKYYEEKDPLVNIAKRWIIACNEENRKIGKCKAKKIIH